MDINNAIKLHTIFSVKKEFFSDHGAKCATSQTEREQATKARQLLICTTFQSSLIWSDQK